MKPQLFAHPFSSYCQKVLIALYENGTDFDYLMLDPEHADIVEQWQALWPVKRFPVLKDGSATVMEATTIIEYLMLQHPGPVPMLPADPAEALRTRMMDRVFDNYIMTPMQKVVFNAIRPEADRDPYGVRRSPRHAGRHLWLAGWRAFKIGMGRRRHLYPCRLRRRPLALLCRLGAPDRRQLGTSARLPRPPARPPLRRPRRR